MGCTCFHYWVILTTKVGTASDDRSIDDSIERIDNVIKRFKSGSLPNTELELHIVESMDIHSRVEGREGGSKPPQVTNNVLVA